MSSPTPAAAVDRPTWWRGLAEQALADFAAVDQDNQTAHAYSYIAGARAQLFGWEDAQVGVMLDKLRSLQNPDGGYGLGFAYDFAGNGSVNPSSTTYTVTLADHVGPILLDGFKAGIIPFSEVKSIVTLLMSTPRIVSANSPYGQCIAYSRHSNDNAAALCVHNVSAGAARFLLDAAAAGVGAGGLAVLVVDITRRETFAYLPAARWWRYMDTPSMQDADHNSYSAESMYHLAYPIGREVAYWHMTNAPTDNAAAPIAHLRLPGLPPRPGSMSADGTTTLWCELSDQWRGELEAFADSSSSDGRRLAQIAYYAARAWATCGGV
jgi:hypothetical protein